MNSQLIFREYKIYSYAFQVNARMWSGSYTVKKDGQVVKALTTVTMRESAENAKASALIYGIQYVDDMLMTARDMLM